MKEVFDENDILRFIYDELEPDEKEAFLEALDDDDSLFEKYQSLKKIHESLDDTRLETPSAVSVDRVLSFARNSGRERAGATFLYGHSKNKILSFNHLVSVLMVFFTLGTITAAVFVYNKAADKNQSAPNLSLDWDNTELNQRIEFARFNLGNIRADNREAILPVYHDTYRVVKTNNFSNLSTPAQNVILLNIK